MNAKDLTAHATAWKHAAKGMIDIAQATETNHPGVASPMQDARIALARLAILMAESYEEQAQAVKAPQAVAVDDCPICHADCAGANPPIYNCPRGTDAHK